MSTTTTPSLPPTPRLYLTTPSPPPTLTLHTAPSFSSFSNLIINTTSVVSLIADQESLR